MWDQLDSLLYVGGFILLLFVAYHALAILFAPISRARRERRFEQSEEGKAGRAQIDRTNAWLAEQRAKREAGQ